MAWHCVYCVTVFLVQAILGEEGDDQRTEQSHSVPGRPCLHVEKGYRQGIEGQDLSAALIIIIIIIMRSYSAPSQPSPRRV